MWLNLFSMLEYGILELPILERAPTPQLEGVRPRVLRKRYENA